MRGTGRARGSDLAVPVLGTVQAHSRCSLFRRCYAFIMIVRTPSAVSLAFLLCLCPALRTPRPAFLVSGQQACAGWSGSSDSCRHGRWCEPPGGALMVASHPANC